MMNTMNFANMDEYLDKSSLEVIIRKITRGKSFHCTNIDLLKKEIDGYQRFNKNYLITTRQTKSEKKNFGMPLFLFRVIVSLIKERDIATRILVQ